MTEILSINHIARSPQVRGGRPVIAGTGICVSDVAVAMIYHRQDPDGIASWYGLSLSQVYAALVYYYDHKAEVDAEIKERSAIADEMKAKRVGSRHKPLFWSDTPR